MIGFVKNKPCARTVQGLSSLFSKFLKTRMKRVASPSLGRVSSLLGECDNYRPDSHNDSASDPLPE